MKYFLVRILCLHYFVINMREFNFKENGSTSNSTCASSIIDRYLKKYDIIDNSVHSIISPTLERRYSFRDVEDHISVVNNVAFNLRSHGYDRGVKNKAIKASELFDAISIRSPIKQIPGKEGTDDDFITVWALISVSVATSVLMAGGSDSEANSAARAVLSSGWNSAGNNCSGTIALSDAAKAASTSILKEELNVELAAIAAVAVYKAGVLVSKNNEHLLKLYKEKDTLPSKCPVTESHVVVKREKEKCVDEGNKISLCQFINYTNEREKYSEYQRNERIISSHKRDEETASMKKRTKSKTQITKSMYNRHTEFLTNTNSRISLMDNRGTESSQKCPLKRISHDSEDGSFCTEETWTHGADTSVLSSIKSLNWIHDTLFSCASFDYFWNDDDIYNNKILSQRSLFQQLKSKGNNNKMNSKGLQTKESYSVVTKTSHVEKPFEDESCPSKEDAKLTLYSSVSENGSNTETNESHSVFSKDSCDGSRQSRDDRTTNSRMDNDTVRVNSKEHDHHTTNFIKDDGGNPLDMFLNSTNPEQENLKRESSMQSSYGRNDDIPSIEVILDNEWKENQSYSVVTKTSHVEKPFEDESCPSKEDAVSTLYSSDLENGSNTETNESHSVFSKDSCDGTRQSRDDRITKSRMDNNTARVNSKEHDHHTTNFIKDDGGNSLEMILNSTNPEQENLKRESSTQSSYVMNDDLPSIEMRLDNEWKENPNESVHSNYKIDRESANTFKNSIKLSPSAEKNINSFPKNNISNAVKTEKANKSDGRPQTKQLVSPKEGEFRLENDHLFEAEDSMPGDKKSDKTNGFIDRLESGMEKDSSRQNKNNNLHPPDSELERLPANVKYRSEPVKKEVTKEKEISNSIDTVPATILKIPISKTMIDSTNNKKHYDIINVDSREKYVMQDITEYDDFSIHMNVNINLESNFESSTSKNYDLYNSRFTTTTNSPIKSFEIIESMLVEQKNRNNMSTRSCNNAISKLKLHIKNVQEISSKTKKSIETAFINNKRKTRYHDLRKKYKDEFLLSFTKQKKHGEKNKKREEDQAFNIIEKQSELKSLYSNLKYKFKQRKNKI